MFEAQLQIAGKAVPARAGATYARCEPIAGRIVTRAAAAQPADAVEAANAAAAAFPGWSASTPSERSTLLNRAADILEARGDVFAAAMAEEIGASQNWAVFNCTLAATILRDAANMTGCLGETEVPARNPGVRGWTVRQPAGVVLGIAPWNAPVVLGVRAVAVPLACGNTTVLKASEFCPYTHALIAEVLTEAGLPAGTVNLVTNAPDDSHAVVEALVAHSAIRRVNFTGSTRIGRAVAELCARHLKPCVLELSGKAPLLVLADADLDAAARAAAYGAFFNQGQICISTERIVVEQAVADEFLQRFVARAGQLQAGDPRNGRYDMGPMISREALTRVNALIDDAVAKGAVLLAGGINDPITMQPTVLDRVTPAMRIYYEESFGPVAAVIRVDSAEEAVSVANDTEYGLAAAVFSRDEVRALDIARRIESGICHINGPTVYDEPQVPFGGMKASGYGRFGGDAGVHEFTELRWISIHDEAHAYPI